MSERKAEPCNPEIGNTEEISRENSDVEALLRWTSFEEVEKIIGPYVSEAIHKAVYGGYKSAREVYVDYQIFNHAFSQLVAGEAKLLFGRYADEYFYHAALEKKKEMLGFFSTMLSSSSVKQSDKDWIINRLAEDSKSKHPVLDTLELNNYWDKNLKMVDEDVRREAIRQKQEKLELLQTICLDKREFLSTKIPRRKQVFENLKKIISSTYSDLELLVKRASTYYRTLRDVKDAMSAARLRRAFQRLLKPEEEKDLSSMWLGETVRTMKLVQEEKEKSDKANDICAAD